jgi:voltage-gated potassium channel
MLTLALTSRRRESAAWGAMFIAIVVLFAASMAILEFERVDGNIKNAEDAVWWSVTTITTVGYGDRYPVTTEGRLVAVALMVVGVGLFGTLSGAAASWFIQPAGESAEPS